MEAITSINGHEIAVLGVLNGHDLLLSQLRQLLARARFVVAADGAALRCRDAGRLPDVVIGDMDSLPVEVRDQFPLYQWEEDQDYTDTQKLLRFVADRGDSAVVLAGIEGDLPDHSLAAWGACLSSSLDIRVELRRGYAVVVRRSARVFVTPGTRISLIPMTPCFDVHLTGVRWPLAGASLALDGQVSISNRAVADTVEVSLGGGTALLFVLRDDKGADPVD